MTYQCRYRNNPMFPYSNKFYKIKKGQPLKNFQNDTSTKSFPKKNFSSKKSSFVFSGILDNILKPVEKIIGRKIDMDDIILMGLIYLLYSEKENDNNTLLLCLIFILIG